MKKLAKNPVIANAGVQDNSPTFTISDIKIFLLEMKELENYDIGIRPSGSDTYTVKVGESSYKLSGKTRNVFAQS